MGTRCDLWSVALGFTITVAGISALHPGELAAADAASSVRHLSGPALSPRLSDLPDMPPSASWQLKVTPPPRRSQLRSTPSDRPRGPDSAQPQPDPPSAAFTGQTTFTGITFNGSLPPDPNIAVGKQYIVQAANSAIAVFYKNGTAVGAPKSIYSLFSGTNLTECSSSSVASSNDAVVQYDNLADRWLITQPGDRNAPYSQCIAVSVSSDPTGQYYLYADAHFGDVFNDYPKLAIWPTASNSAYLASYNLGLNGTAIGSDLCAYDRDAMLSGKPLVSLCSRVSDLSFLPADLDGMTPPKDGTPAYFLNIETRSSLRLYQLSPDFMTPTPTVTLSQPLDIAVARFTEACVDACVPQPSTSTKLEALGDRLMYRLAYRVFADHVAMVVNHTVIGGLLNAGVRWYELRPARSSAFGIYQYGTFSPNTAYRWMGSMAMDKLGDIALGYSESSSTIYPELAYTGRMPAMTLGTMGTEAVLQFGGGSQTGNTRWGDYSAMRIDPSDDCTFWYTNEYYPVTASSSWSTAIGSFRFSSCQ